MSIRRRQVEQETRGEREERARGNFDGVENTLARTTSILVPFASWVKVITSLLGGNRSPLNKQRADPKQHTVWLLDCTAYQQSSSQQKTLSPSRGGGGSNKKRRQRRDHHHQQQHHRHDHHDDGHKDGPPPAWQVEVVACIFEQDSREDVGKMVALIADMVGVDGRFGVDDDREVRKRMAKRVQPFLSEVVPGRFLTLDVPLPLLPHKQVRKYRLRPSNKHGIVSQTVRIGQTDNHDHDHDRDHQHQHITDGSVVRPSLRQWPRRVSMDMVFAAPEGWAIVSDVDDTIKHTQTADPIGILRTTFVEDPTPITGMPQLYYHIARQLDPTWFYLSASPYNLYPFLRPFLRAVYPHGTLLLRENSWMDISGLLKSFTQGTQAYKVSRMQRLHRWFPKRKVLCIGDSTQSDPETFAEMYRKRRKWIRAIFIRKVTDVGNMDDKNTDERFKKAFKGVPSRVWTVFEQPEELYQLVDELRFGRR